MKRWYVAIIVYYLALGSIKITLLVQYRRLFAAKIHMLINCVLAVVVAWSVAVMLLNVFVCWPIPYCELFWTRLGDSPHEHGACPAPLQHRRSTALTLTH